MGKKDLYIIKQANRAVKREGIKNIDIDWDRWADRCSNCGRR